jgi:hypothetical protein
MSCLEIKPTVQELLRIKSYGEAVGRFRELKDALSARETLLDLGLLAMVYVGFALPFYNRCRKASGISYRNAKVRVTFFSIINILFRTYTMMHLRR